MPSKHETLFLLVVTKITVFAASALLLIPALSASALTLGSRVVARQDAGSIASLAKDSALDEWITDPIGKRVLDAVSAGDTMSTSAARSSAWSATAARLGTEPAGRWTVIDGRNGIPCPHTSGILIRPC